MAKITYQNETTIEEEDLDLTLLQISLKHGIPHTHACGGHARCSTCRVIILENGDHLYPRNDAEQALSTKKGLEHNIRLACQTKISGSVSLRRLVIDDKDIALVDVIHILNRYFQQMGESIIQNHGYIDKYMGDGIMALFGLDGTNPTDSCWNAILAARQMHEGLEKLNEYLRRYFDMEFRIGIGIHFGNVLIGEIGHPNKMQFTAIGDAVNLASRIESATKEFKTELLISDAVYSYVKAKVQTGREFEAKIKGKSGLYSLHEVLGLQEQS